jgi:hypothetical protein
MSAHPRLLPPRVGRWLRLGKRLTACSVGYDPGPTSSGRAASTMGLPALDHHCTTDPSVARSSHSERQKPRPSDDESVRLPPRRRCFHAIALVGAASRDSRLRGISIVFVAGRPLLLRFVRSASGNECAGRLPSAGDCDHRLAVRVRARCLWFAVGSCARLDARAVTAGQFRNEVAARRGWASLPGTSFARGDRRKSTLTRSWAESLRAFVRLALWRVSRRGWRFRRRPPR